ncbi:MAG: DUF2267 domain-containing protein [Chloroflexi bacterium]|nr:DUF2267 domain-containing protein [Chloroflexota bacterium]
MEATDRWLTGIAAHLGWADRHKAYVALRVTLHALRDQVMLDECAQLSAQLPLIIRGMYWEGWNPRHRTWQTPHHSDFLMNIHGAFHHDPVVDPEKVAKAVFQVMSEHISRGEMEDIRGVVPKDIRALMLAGSEAATTH